MFKKKSKPQNLETELAALRQRVGALDAKRVAAEAELAVATEARQTFHVEGDIDDVGTAQKLQDAVNAAASRIVGLEDAISVIQTQITDIERRLDADRMQAERAAASATLSANLDEVEKALPGCMQEGRRLVSALQELHHNFEAMQAAEFLANVLSQIEIAAHFVLTEQRAMVPGVADGSMPIPPAKEVPAPVVAPEPAPEIRRVFALRTIKWKDAAGRQQYCQQFEDADLPLATAEQALRHNAVTRLDDDRRKQLRGARGGQHANPNAVDLLDLDALEGWSGARHASFDAVVQANFTPFDRGPDRTAAISVLRL